MKQLKIYFDGHIDASVKDIRGNAYHKIHKNFRFDIINRIWVDDPKLDTLFAIGSKMEIEKDLLR